MPNTTPASRREGVLAVHSVHEFVYSVPDLNEAERFYTSFGLDVRHEGNGLALYSFGNPHRWARILPSGHAKRLLWVTWGIDARDLAAFEAHFNKLNITRIVRPELATGEDGLWFQGPDNMPQQLVVAEKCSPSVKSDREFPPEQSPRGRAPQRSQIKQVRPRRLSHILMYTADVTSTLKFYTDVLGLRLSDRSDSFIAFIHTPHGSDHHLIAIFKSDGYGLHHSSWDVRSFDEVGLGAQQMSQAGYTKGWGVGRHVLGSNYFRYVRDPWGSYAEYSFDIDYVPSTLDWPSGDYPAEDSFYVWGPDVPEDFVTNFETKEAANA